jgi:hypothetical protein
MKEKRAHKNGDSQRFNHDISLPLQHIQISSLYLWLYIIIGGTGRLIINLASP